MKDMQGLIKKLVILSFVMIIVALALVGLYGAYATGGLQVTHTFTLTGDTSIEVPANSDKLVYYRIKNTNPGTVNYAVGYSSQSNDIAVKVYQNSPDPASGSVSQNTSKNVKLRLYNNSNAAVEISLTTVLGFENGGNLIVPSGVTLVTETCIFEKGAQYITNMYTNAEKTTANNGASGSEITYNLATSVNLMNDRLGSSSTGIDAGNIRYYGANPNNYVWLGDTYTADYTIPGNVTLDEYADQEACIEDGNSEAYCTEDIVRHAGDKKLWRVIGVFDGRVKLVTADPISTQGLSWDTSATAAGGNGGYGINEWGPSGSYEGADLMRLLNPGYENETVNNSLYWNKSAGTVYTGSNNVTTADVSFANTGLSASEKNLIDTATWYTGANDEYSYVDGHYTAERGNTGKICTQNNSDCSDTVTRTSSWTGKVGLIYGSDYGYAANLVQCNQTLNAYYEDGCWNNNWLKPSSGLNWTVSPFADSDGASSVFFVEDDGNFLCSTADLDSWVWPAVYLKSGVLINTSNGNDGSEAHPYELSY